MTDHEMLMLDVTREERERIETQARQHGFGTARDYLLALVAEDVEGDEVEAYFNTDPEGAFRQAWQEAMTGQIHPVATLWDDLDDE